MEVMGCFCFCCIVCCVRCDGCRCHSRGGAYIRAWDDGQRDPPAIFGLGVRGVAVNDDGCGTACYYFYLLLWGFPNGQGSRCSFA